MNTRVHTLHFVGAAVCRDIHRLILDCWGPFDNCGQAILPLALVDRQQGSSI